jgi:hypothetical protein
MTIEIWISTSLHVAERDRALDEAIAAAIRDVTSALALEPPAHRVLSRDGEPLVTIEVDGRPCRYSPELACRAWHRVDGWASLPTTRRELAAALAAAPEARRIAWLAALCHDVLWSHRARLVDARAGERAFGAAAAVLGASCTAFARALVSQGLDLADAGALAEHVSREHARGSDLEAIVETLISARGGNTIEIRLRTDDLRALTSDARSPSPSPSPSPSASPFAAMRDRLFYELGWKFPVFRFVTDDTLAPHSVAFRFKRIPIAAFRGLAPGELACNAAPSPGERAIIHPFKWLRISVGRRAVDGASSWTPLEWIALHLEHELRRHCSLFVHHDAVHGLIERTSDVWPVLVDAARRRFSVATITQVIRLLLAEAVSIRNLRVVLSSLCDYDTIVADQHEHVVFDDRLAVAAPLEGDHDRAVHVAAHVRAALKRQLSFQYTRGSSTLVVYLLDRAIESGCAGRALEPALEDRLVRGLSAERGDSRQPIVILTTSDTRPHVRAAVADEFPDVDVLSYAELSPDLNIQPIARIS